MEQNRLLRYLSQSSVILALLGFWQSSHAMPRQYYTTVPVVQNTTDSIATRPYIDRVDQRVMTQPAVVVVQNEYGNIQPQSNV